jgi:hypothetical protein
MIEKVRQLGKVVPVVCRSHKDSLQLRKISEDVCTPSQLLAAMLTVMKNISHLHS